MSNIKHTVRILFIYFKQNSNLSHCYCLVIDNWICMPKINTKTNKEKDVHFIFSYIIYYMIVKIISNVNKCFYILHDFLCCTFLLVMANYNVKLQPGSIYVTFSKCADFWLSNLSYSW